MPCHFCLHLMPLSMYLQYEPKSKNNQNAGTHNKNFIIFLIEVLFSIELTMTQNENVASPVSLGCVTFLQFY